MTDSTKAQVWKAIYEPFGTVYSTTGTAAQTHRFPGQWFQIESGLAYNWHRHYDATLGRYVSADPLGLVDGPSVYGYVGQAPLAYIDPEGLFPKKYEKPVNPNQRKGAEDRQKSGDRERNRGHKDGEEHSVQPKGGKFRKGFTPKFFGPWIIDPCYLAPQLCSPDLISRVGASTCSNTDQNNSKYIKF